jgi:hypothetical protein
MLLLAPEMKTWSRVLLENLLVAQLLNKFPLYSQDHATELYHEANKSSPRPQALFL